MKKILSIFVVILILAGGTYAYWYFFMRETVPPVVRVVPNTAPGGFSPLSTTTAGYRPPVGGAGVNTATGTTTPTTSKIVTLRLLSTSPIGGYYASSTGTTTRVRWVDRGRGNVYEASYSSPEIVTLSNTVVPKIFKSVWNKNLTAFIGSLYENNDLVPTTVYAEMTRQSTSTLPRNASTSPTTASNITPYELKGKTVPGNVIGYAVSPDHTQVFILMNESGNGVGYISSFNGQNMTRIFSTPLTQLNVAWPSDSIIALTTKGSANYSGYLYFANPKIGSWKKILGPVPGLSAVVSHDGKNVIYSAYSKTDGLTTNLYSVNSATTTGALIRTVADKCAWGNYDKSYAYCGVPSQLPAGTYPDAWYLGTVNTIDKLWKINSATGELKQLSSLVDQADRLINISNVELDPKDKYVFFVNKNDLSFWSFDLATIKR